MITGFDDDMIHQNSAPLVPGRHDPSSFGSILDGAA